MRHQSRRALPLAFLLVFSLCPPGGPDAVAAGGADPNDQLEITLQEPGSAPPHRGGPRRALRRRPEATSPGGLEGLAGLAGYPSLQVQTTSGEIHIVYPRIAPDATQYDRFGSRAAIRGNTLAVASSPTATSGLLDSVYIFTLGSGTWNSAPKFSVGSVPGEFGYGWAMAVSDETVLVGAWKDDDVAENAGAVYVYQDLGAGWMQVDKLTASDGLPFDHFGTGVSADGDRLAIGAPGVDGAVEADVGAVYIFEWNGSAWIETDKIMTDTEYQGAVLGQVVSLSRDTLAASSKAFLAYNRIFVKNGPSWTLEASIYRPSSSFRSLALSGDLYVQGRYEGPIHVYHRDAGVWTEEAQLEGSDAWTYYDWGIALDLAGDYLVTGAVELGPIDPPSVDQGTGYVFQRSASGWTETARLHRDYSSWNREDGFGDRIVTDGQRVVMSAIYGPAPSHKEPGAIYIFDLADIDNLPPVALCQDVELPADSVSCAVGASVDAGSYDPDSNNSLTLTQSPAGPYGRGSRLVTLTVRDTQGGSDSCQGQVTVVDGTPPAGSLAFDPTLLFPPNHRMVQVDLAGAFSDNCYSPANLQVAITGITSSEPDDDPGAGDGETTGDIQAPTLPGTLGQVYKLRAERSGPGPGRMYTFFHIVSDPDGNTASGQTQLPVPHNMGGVVEPVMLDITPSALQWTAAPDAVTYDVISGSLAGIGEGMWPLGSVTVLDSVSCLADDTSSTSVSSAAFSLDPPPGGATYFMVRYEDAAGRGSGYGTATARGELAVLGPGDCP